MDGPKDNVHKPIILLGIHHTNQKPGTISIYLIIYSKVAPCTDKTATILFRDGMYE